MSEIEDQAKAVLVKLVTSLLVDKPKDPVSSLIIEIEYLLLILGALYIQLYD